MTEIEGLRKWSTRDGHDRMWTILTKRIRRLNDWTQVVVTDYVAGQERLESTPRGVAARRHFDMILGAALAHGTGHRAASSM